MRAAPAIVFLRQAIRSMAPKTAPQPTSATRSSPALSGSRARMSSSIGCTDGNGRISTVSDRTEPIEPAVVRQDGSLSRRFGTADGRTIALFLAEGRRNSSVRDRCHASIGTSDEAVKLDEPPNTHRKRRTQCLQGAVIPVGERERAADGLQFEHAVRRGNALRPRAAISRW
jgi:hypothetical protein